MQGPSRLKLIVNHYRAVNSATILIGDITVLSGVNACGKSTLAHLTHSLVNLSRDYKSLACEYAWRPIGRLAFEVASFGSRLRDLLGAEDISPDEDPYRMYRRGPSKGSWNSRKDWFEHLISGSLRLYRDALVKYPEEAKRYATSFLADVDMGQMKDLDQITLNQSLHRLIEEAESRLSELLRVRSVSAWGVASREAVKWVQYSGSVKLYEGDECVYSSADSVLKEVLGVEHAFYIESPWRNIPTVDPESGAVSISDGFDLVDPDSSFVPEDDLFAVLEGSLEESKEQDRATIFTRRFLSRRTQWTFARQDGHGPIPLEECATGIKSLSILNLLYKKGCLGRKTLLVVDEPEAHLHPQWILEYAKILVQLNRRLGVRLLVTTHSPDMLNAIRRVANVEQVPDLRFYLAEEVSALCKYDFDYRNLGRNVEPIFEKFNLAADKAEAYPQDL